MSPARWGGSCNKEPAGRGARPMTNRIAFALAAMIAALLLADHLWLHLDLALQAGRRLAALVEYLAFWR